MSSGYLLLLDSEDREGTGIQITWPFSRPFYEGTGGAGSSELVPSVFPVALAGRPYMLDDSEWGVHHHESIPLLRGQADQSSRPGEQSLNPEDFWRRSQESWHKGAGQTFYDQQDSDEARYSTSKGIDPWTRGQVSLLHSTNEIVNTTDSPLLAAAAGAYLYLLQGTALRYSQSITAPSWTTVTGAGLTGAASIASSGYYVWVATTTDLYYTTRGAATYSAWHSGPLPVGVVRYVRGRLMLAGTGATKHVIYQAADLGVAAPSALYTHDDPDFTWVDFAEGANQIYAAGYSGDKSIIYRTQVKADGTALDVPVAAAQLPDGEIVRSLHGYLGFVLIGTDSGVRFSVPNTNGDLELGALIPTANAVKCFEGQDRFVWFGWTNYDSTSSGLGRLDLSVLNDTTPAWASDLMGEAQGAVTSVVTFSDRRVFTVDGDGLFVETGNKVASGTIDSGRIAYGLPDSKTVVAFDVQNAEGAGQIVVWLSTDDGAFGEVGEPIVTSAALAGKSVIDVDYTTGEYFVVRLVLTRDGVTLTQAPVVTRWTLRADPSARRRMKIVVPFLFHRRLQPPNGMTRTIDPRVEYSRIRTLAESKQPVTYQEGADTWTVVVDDYRWVPRKPAGPPNYDFEGTCVVTLKTLSTK